MAPKIGKIFAIAALTSVLLSACAGVSFYSDQQLQTKTGIPIYAAKPYLLVARTEAKDKPIEVSVIYLPDSQHVIYADPRSGFGSAKLTLALANGQLSSFGQETDPKIAELIGSISGLITARAGAEKTMAEAGAIGAGTLQAAKPSVEIGKSVSAVAKDMKSKLPPASKELGGLTGQQQQQIISVQKALEIAGQTLENPQAAPLAQTQLDVVKAQVEILEKFPAPSVAGTKMDAALQLVQTWAAELKKSYEESQPEKPAQPTFELYEILQGPSGAQLKPVVLK